MSLGGLSVHHGENAHAGGAGQHHSLHSTHHQHGVHHVKPQAQNQRDVTPFGFSIPHAHARIWWTPARLAQAREWYAAHPFTPQASDPWNNALAYVVTGKQAYANNAIQSLMAFNISEQELHNTASDVYRWNDWVPVVYDWVQD